MLNLDSQRWCISTDLDGTLLDHHNYRFDAAQPALDRIRALGLPLILNTSKTLLEALNWQQRFHTQAPLVLENGALVAIHADQFDRLQTPAQAQFEAIDIEGKTLWLKRFGPSYEQILEALAQMKADGFRFSGFSDMSVVEIAKTTGLNHQEAALAKRREATEPLVWLGSEQELVALSERLAPLNLQVTRGGRFVHIIPKSDKGTAFAWLMQEVLDHRESDPLSWIALGDSHNDISMLERADIAVVIRKPSGQWLPLQRTEGVIYTRHPGPAGWAEAMERLLP